MSNGQTPLRIVLTGGPCGGKTSALEHLTTHLEGLGVRVFSVPEVATMLIGGGADLGRLDTLGLLSFERNLIRVQMALEETFTDLARREKGPAVVVCDRGAMDISAYLSAEAWRALLDGEGWTEVALRDRRYDAVLHLVTAAIGAEAFYTTANNAARTETPAQAAALDRRVRDAWLGHPHLRVFGNTGDFSEKLEAVSAAVAGLLGIPEPLEIERKFLVADGFDPTSLPVASRTFLIEQTYLSTDSGAAERVRSRRADGAAVYTHTIKREIRPGERVEHEHQITGDEFLSLAERADPTRKTVRKERRCFLWEDQYFELDTLIEPHPGLTLLELELESLDAAISLPPFVPIAREVTSDRRYNNSSLALDTPLPEGAA